MRTHLGYEKDRRERSFVVNLQRSHQQSTGDMQIYHDLIRLALPSCRWATSCFYFSGCMQACQAWSIALAPDKHEIACTRSFGHPVTAPSDLREAVSEFTSRAAEKLRRQSGHARHGSRLCAHQPLSVRPAVQPVHRDTAATAHREQLSAC